MSGEKNNNNSNAVVSYPLQMIMSMSAAALATFMCHPFRVYLNEASVNKDILGTIKNARFKIFQDWPLNLLRGTASTGLQKIANDSIQYYFKSENVKAEVLGLFAAASVGVVISPIEKSFMQKNAFRESPFADKPAVFQKSLCRPYNLSILTFLGMRELGFVTSVFFGKKQPLYLKIPIFFCSALITAMAHRLLTIEITKSIRDIAHVVPNYSIGFKAVIRNIAKGDVYQHPAFAVPIKNPKTKTQLAYNFFSATCGHTMLFYRGLYLVTIAEALGFADAHIKKGHEYSRSRTY